MKYIAVSGGVISGIGKGIISSSSGLLLKTLGYKVTAIKIDPYLNIDAGTMSPLEHGEVFVLNDGAEADLDLGNYERYLNIDLTRNNNLTTGKIYLDVIERERKGEYLGKTVQVVPHITNAIQDWIHKVASLPSETPDICIIELGGTIGDIESAPFVEALRQMQFKLGKENFALIHVSLVPVINGEQKTKPTQAAIKELRGLGLVPDMIACRCAAPLEAATITKVSNYCQVPEDHVLGVHDVASTYHVPILLQEQNLGVFLQDRLRLHEIKIPDSLIKEGQLLFKNWKLITRTHDQLRETVKIALVGKYTDLKDSYISVVKSLEHSALRCNRKLDLKWIDSSDLEEITLAQDSKKYYHAWSELCKADGILVPGGFGNRGTEGMIAAAKMAREKSIPYLGICLGLQIAVIEYARNVIKIEGPGSSELNPGCKNEIVIEMLELSKTHMGGTMRLGLRSTVFQKDTEWSRIRKLYKEAEEVHERHRHRYEINPAFHEQIEKAGLSFVGKDETGQRIEIIELKNHPYFVATQYHPEYLSRPTDPSPPYLGLVAAASGVLDRIIASALHPNGMLRLDSTG